jgi:hypothetical protein
MTALDGPVAYRSFEEGIQVIGSMATTRGRRSRLEWLKATPQPERAAPRGYTIATQVIAAR